MRVPTPWRSSFPSGAFSSIAQPGHAKAHWRENKDCKDCKDGEAQATSTSAQPTSTHRLWERPLKKAREEHHDLFHPRDAPRNERVSNNPCHGSGKRFRAGQNRNCSLDIQLLSRSHLSFCGSGGCAGCTDRPNLGWSAPFEAVGSRGERSRKWIPVHLAGLQEFNTFREAAHYNQNHSSVRFARPPRPRTRARSRVCCGLGNPEQGCILTSRLPETGVGRRCQT